MEMVFYQIEFSKLIKHCNLAYPKSNTVSVNLINFL